MEMISKYTCLKFVARSSQTEYIKIFEGQGCNSYIGMMPKSWGGRFVFAFAGYSVRDRVQSSLPFAVYIRRLQYPKPRPALDDSSPTSSLAFSPPTGAALCYQLSVPLKLSGP